MGRLQTFDLPGCRLWFHTGDHGPPHFHAGVVDAWEIRVFFLQEPPGYEVKFEVGRIPSRVLRSLLDSAAEHRVALFGEWERNQADD